MSPEVIVVPGPAVTLSAVLGGTLAGVPAGVTVGVLARAAGCAGLLAAATSVVALSVGVQASGRRARASIVTRRAPTTMGTESAAFGIVSTAFGIESIAGRAGPLGEELANGAGLLGRDAGAFGCGARPTAFFAECTASLIAPLHGARVPLGAPRT